MAKRPTRLRFTEDDLSSDAVKKAAGKAEKAAAKAEKLVSKSDKANVNALSDGLSERPHYHLHIER